MAITVGTNIASLQAQRRLSISTDLLGKTYERLSSGQRINRASDDAAGLAIADTLKADQRIANVAIRNANDGISTIAIADSALGQIGNVVSRLAELAEQFRIHPPPDPRMFYSQARPHRVLEKGTSWAQHFESLHCCLGAAPSRSGLPQVDGVAISLPGSVWCCCR